MPEPDPPPRSDRSRPSGVGSDPSASPRPFSPLDDTDVIAAPPASSLRGAESSSQPSSGRRELGSDLDGRYESRALPNLGEKIDEFRLVESIGAGGMGAVFRAVDVGLDRQVALKILPPEQAVDPEVVRRYHQEGRAAARLDHENIARVYTIGDDGRYHYIAFEYIEGVTIRQMVIRDGPLTVADAIHFTLQIAHALIHAAEREVVHRDIKPSNIIVTPGGRAKLVDMGLARQFERRGDADLTQTGMTLGTFDYISPEQARDPRDVDIRGDLYSLGCTLFHMLSGRPPFPEGTVLQKLIQHREETPPDIRGLNPDVPDALAAILVKLLIKERDHRYQTPEHLARDLGAIAIPGALTVGLPLPIASPTYYAPSSTPNWARHLFWGGPGLVFLLLLAGVAWWGDGPQAAKSLNGVRFSPNNPDKAATPSFAPGSLAGRTPGVGLSPARPDPKPKPTPTVEPIPPREVAVSPTDDLGRILAEAPPKSSILLVERGPYELRSDRPIRLDRRDLTIRAEAGVRPLIRFARDFAPVPAANPSSPTSGLIDIRGGRVTFDGIDFLVDASSFDPALGADRTAGFGSGAKVFATISAEDAEVVVRRCSFRRSNGSGSGQASIGRPAAIRSYATPRASSTRGDGLVASMVIDASDFDGHQIGLLMSGPVDVSIRDAAFGATLGEQASIWSDNADPSATPGELRLEHVSGLMGAGPMFRFLGTSPRVLARHSVFGPIPSAAEFTPSTLVAIDTPDRLDWRGADNLYARIAVYLRSGGSRPQPPIRGFATWADDPATFRESGSSSYEGVVWERLPMTSQNMVNSLESPRSFRLALPRSVARQPGARWGPSGPLPQPVRLATSGAINRTILPEPSTLGDRPASPATPVPSTVPAPRRASATGFEPREESPEEMPPGLTPMPMPTDPDRPPAAEANGSDLGRIPGPS